MCMHTHTHTSLPLGNSKLSLSTSHQGWGYKLSWPWILLHLLACLFRYLQTSFIKLFSHHIHQCYPFPAHIQSETHWEHAYIRESSKQVTTWLPVTWPTSKESPWKACCLSWNANGMNSSGRIICWEQSQKVLCFSIVIVGKCIKIESNNMVESKVGTPLLPGTWNSGLSLRTSHKKRNPRNMMMIQIQLAIDIQLEVWITLVPYMVKFHS